MTVLDSEDYSQDVIEYILAILAEVLKDEGRSLDARQIFYFNAYLGKTFFSFEKHEYRWHICQQTSFGQIFTIFHQVQRNKVVRTENELIGSQYDNCITLLWTAEQLDLNHAKLALELADDVVRNFELATGRSCPIPLGSDNLRTMFEITQLDFKKRKIEKHIVNGHNGSAPLLTPEISNRLHALAGLNEQFNERMKTPPHSTIALASRWQQKAIRAIGNNEWADCVIASSVWVEIFVVQVTAQINELLDNPIVDLRSALSRGLPQFINANLGSCHLKGNWDHTNDTTPVGIWYRDCYDVRNEIAHAGKIPTREIGIKAYSSAHEFVKVITEKIARLSDSRLDAYLPIFRSMALEQRKKANSSGVAI